MRRAAWFLGLASGVLGGLAAAQQPKAEHVVDWQPRVFPLHGAGEIEIHAPVGRLQIVAGPEGRVTLSATLRTTARDPELAKQASRASTVLATADGDKIRIDEQVSDPPKGSTTCELHVEVPPRAQVRVRGGRVAIEAQRLAGPLDVTSKSGSVQVTLAGPATVHAETRGGKLEQDLGLAQAARGKLVTAEGRVDGGGPTVVVQTGGAVTLRAAR